MKGGEAKETPGESLLNWGTKTGKHECPLIFYSRLVLWKYLWGMFGNNGANMTFNKDIVNSPLHVWPLPHSVLSFKKSQRLINTRFCILRTLSQNGRFLPGAFEHKWLRAVTNGGAEGTEALANSKDCVRIRRSKVQMSSLKRRLFHPARQALQLLFTHTTLQALKA